MFPCWLCSAAPISRSPGPSHRHRLAVALPGPRPSARGERDWERGRERERASRREPSPEEPSATVLLRNLPEWAADEDVFALLGEWGPLKSVRVIKDRQTGLSKGFGFVDFPTVEAASAMMEGVKLKGGLSLGDRALSLHYSRPLPDSVAGRASALKPMDWICSFCQVGTLIPSPDTSLPLPLSLPWVFAPSSDLLPSLRCPPPPWVYCVLWMPSTNHSIPGLLAFWGRQVSNFARRTECFRCHNQRTEDCQVIDSSGNPKGPPGGAPEGQGGACWGVPPGPTEAMAGGLGGGMGGGMGGVPGGYGREVQTPTHVLMVRGLNEDTHEESLRHEFSQHGEVTVSHAPPSLPPGPNLAAL